MASSAPRLVIQILDFYQAVERVGRVLVAIDQEHSNYIRDTTVRFGTPKAENIHALHHFSRRLDPFWKSAPQLSCPA